MSDQNAINLVLIYTPNALDVGDFEKIAGAVKATADNIEVHIRRDEAPGSADLDALAERPTMLFSPMHLNQYFIKRGTVFCGRPMQKSEQLLRLQLAGVPVPEWTSLDRGKRFDEGHWGEYVVTKPEIDSRGRGVMVTRTSGLNANSARFKPFARDARNFIVQKLVTNKRYHKIRVQTLFDEVLYARRFSFSEEVKFDTDEDMRHFQELFVTENSQAENYDAEITLNYAKRCFEAFDGVPMLALDVLLDEDEQPYFIEANPGGNTWHFSSAMVGRGLRERGVFLEEQFDAFNLAGKVLAERALAEAT